MNVQCSRNSRNAQLWCSSSISIKGSAYYEWVKYVYIYMLNYFGQTRSENHHFKQLSHVFDELRRSWSYKYMYIIQRVFEFNSQNDITVIHRWDIRMDECFVQIKHERFLMLVLHMFGRQKRFDMGSAGGQRKHSFILRRSIRWTYICIYITSSSFGAWA